jgi:hypothetical protein
MAQIIPTSPPVSPERARRSRGGNGVARSVTEPINCPIGVRMLLEEGQSLTRHIAR